MDFQAIVLDQLGLMVSWIEGGNQVTVTRDSAGRPLLARAAGSRSKPYAAEFRYDQSGRFLGVRGEFVSVMFPRLLEEAARGGGGDVTATTGPGGGVEKFTVSGIRRADGTVAPVLDTGDGWELLNGWHPRQLFEDGTPGEIFDNRSSLMLRSITAPAISDVAGNGDPVLVRSGTMTPGRAWTALNELTFSEDLASWMTENATITTDGGVGTVSVASGDGYAQILISRAVGGRAVFAMEIAPSGAARYACVGPGGVGRWFDLQSGTALALGDAGYTSRVVPSTDGYVWCIVERIAEWTVSTNTGFRVYPSTVSPIDPAPTGGNNTAPGGVRMRRAFYSQHLPAPFVPERDYNYTNAAIPTTASVGNCCVQLDTASAPVKSGLLLDFAGSKTMTAVFQEAPGASATIGRAVPGLGAQIETASVGVELPVSASDTALVVIGRALTGAETVLLRDWLNVRALAAAEG